MSFLEQFLKESSMRRTASADSEEGDIEDNRAPSIVSSKSNTSERSPHVALSGASSENQVAPHQHSSPSSTSMSIPMQSMSTLSSTVSLRSKSHQFIVRSFSSPLKCNHCTSLMVGLVRQGVVCEVCGFACHVACKDKVPHMCPLPADQTKRPLGIDPTRGIGTAYEGYVKVPKPGGVKKGWLRQFVVVCDFKLFLYDISAERNALPAVAVSQVLDMRDEQFDVSSVRDSDVIHANKKDIPCIFRVSTSMMDPPGVRNQLLMLADSESEKTKWVVALNELHRILKRNKLPNKAVFKAKEVLDNTITLLKTVMTGTVIDTDRLVLGTEEGLLCIDLDREEIGRVGDNKRIYQVDYIPEEQLLIAICGKQHHVRLIPVRALDGDDVEWLKAGDTKGCLTFTTGLLRQSQGTHAAVYCICVALKRQVLVFEITRTKARHKKLKDILLPAPAQCLQVISDGRLCVGYASGFAIYSLTGDHHPQALIQLDHPSLTFLSHQPLDALCSVELANQEYLLVFSSLAIYVDSYGRKSREKEIMYPAPPIAIVHNDGHLLLYSETHIDVMECSSGEWIQTVNVKRSRPLSSSGVLSASFASELPHVVYMRNLLRPNDSVNVPQTELSLSGQNRSGSSQPRTRRRFSVRENNRAARAPTNDRRTKLISAPSNFNHISHMGPGDGIQMQRLLDLPSAMEKAELASQSPTYNQPSYMAGSVALPGISGSSSNTSISGSPSRMAEFQQQQQGMQRVRSMFQQSTGKLTTARLPPQPADPPMPRRSISHSGTGIHNGVPAPGLPPRRPAPQAPPHSRPFLHIGGSASGTQSMQRTPEGQMTPVTPGSAHLQQAPFSYPHDAANGSPRHSIASNSSGLSNPPSPGIVPVRDRDSYDT